MAARWSDQRSIIKRVAKSELAHFVPASTTKKHTQVYASPDRGDSRLNKPCIVSFFGISLYTTTFIQ